MSIMYKRLKCSGKVPCVSTDMRVEKEDHKQYRCRVCGAPMVEFQDYGNLFAPNSKRKPAKGKP